MQLGEGFIRVRPDTRDFDRDLQNQVEGGFGRAASNLRNALQFGATIAGFKQLTDAASTLQQAVGGTAAVFGESQSTIDEWAKGAAEAAGLSERAARELTSQIGGLLQGFGFAQDEAADMSITLAQLGADLAATFGGTTEEAVQALGAALRGETDPLERFGIALNQTLVNTKAVELGLATSTSAVDQNAKAQATLALITERSANAQGQFAREADTAAGQAQIAAAKTENASADLGENLLPIYTKIAETVGIVAAAFGSLPEPVQTAVLVLGGIAALAGPAKAAFDVMSTGAAAIRAGFERAAAGASNLAGSLGKITVGAGAVGAALFIGSKILGDYIDQQAEAERVTDDLTRAMEEQGGAIGELSKEQQGTELLQGELGQSFRDAGGDLAIFTDAIAVGDERLNDLQRALKDAGGIDFGNIEDLSGILEDAGLAGTELGDELVRLQQSGELTDGEFADLIIRLGDLSTRTRDAAREFENQRAAGSSAAEETGNVGAAAGGAAPQVAALGGAMGGAADETADFEEVLKGAREELTELLDIVNSAADAELAYRDAVDQTEDSLQAYLEANHLALHLKGRNKEANEALSDAERELESDTLDAAEAAGKAAEQQALLTGAHFDAKDAANAQILELVRMRDAVGADTPLGRKLNEHIYQLAAIPDRVETTIAANTAVARGDLQGYLQLLEVARTDPAAALRAIQHPQTAGQPLGVGHAGYTVPGLPGEEVPVIALAGERIVPRGDPSLAGDGGGTDRSIHVGTIQVMPGDDPVRKLFDTARAEEFLGGLG